MNINIIINLKSFLSLGCTKSVSISCGYNHLVNFTVFTRPLSNFDTFLRQQEQQQQHLESGKYSLTVQRNHFSSFSMSSTDESGCDRRIVQLKQIIRTYPDFPKKGILFYDVLPILAEPKALHDTIEIFVEQINQISGTVDYVVGIEARGFLFGTLVAQRLNCPFIPLRKPGKLPGKVRKQTYALEYGEDSIEIKEDAIKPKSNCVLIDDLLATGGTMGAGIKLIESIGSNVILSLVIIELLDLKGRNKVSSPIYSIFQF
ncbi:adenine phosphoribosyltransferase [Brevipalpus obovatus]|uniref:adenine phosphoribosyltransferase n=1 Tax=Brevipalpus obovatus TaxID=246614 RepID=UPI003D9F6BB0